MDAETLQTADRSASPSTMAEAAAGIFYGVRTVVETAALAAKGIYDPTLPLKSTLTPLTSVPVKKAYHSISVIKGRAYLFGGKESESELADNDVHIVVLPTSAMEQADYKCIPASGESPPKRYGHAAAVIDDRLYVFGGSSEGGEPLDEKGRVWVFDTLSNSWSHYDPPPEGEKPAPRSSCAAVASEHPRPVAKRTDEGSLPQDPPDPAKIVPEPPAADTYGTLIVQGGHGKGGEQLNDLWSFDISTRTWTEMPQPPTPVSSSPSLALVGSRLYSFSVGFTHYLDLTQSSFDDRGGAGELGLAPLGPWSSISSSSVASPSQEGDGEAEGSKLMSSGPGERTSASLIPVTTGQGRNYLLLIGGQAQNVDAQSSEVYEDIFALQLRPEGMTAASFKDAARQAIKKDTLEATWDEVRYHDSEGKMVQEGQEGRGVGARKGMTAAIADGVDGASVLVWGGVDGNGEVREDGVMVNVDR